MIDLMRNILISLLFFSFASLADIFGEVIKVVDGDTVNVRDYDNTVHKIRLAGIDAPEMSQPYGKESRSYLLGLIYGCLLYTYPRPRDLSTESLPSSA